MSKEIILPPHLYDRIKASAGEHGGIGRGSLFSDPIDFTKGVPVCAHGHAWGTCTRYEERWASGRQGKVPRLSCLGEEPELLEYLSAEENDGYLNDLAPVISEEPGFPVRISFDEWCRRLNVKRGVTSAVAPVVDLELAVD